MKSHKDFLVLNYNTELKLPEQLYGTIKRVGILNKEPILYGDANLLKPNDLYYIDSIKQVYRFVASETMYEQLLSQLDPGLLLANSNDKTVNKYRIFLFTSINYKPYDVFEEELTIPEEERGTIRNAGYLFNEIIYSGDPNLVENGQLFYHDNLPFINVVGISRDIITLATKTRLSGIDDATTIYTSYRVTPHSYSKDYLTFEALEDGTFTFTMTAKLPTTCVPSISYSTDNGKTWSTTTNVDNQEVVVTTPTITQGSKVLWKSESIQFYVNPDQWPGSNRGYGSFTSSGNYNVKGNIMSLLYGDNFNKNNTFKECVSTGYGAGAFAYLFHNNAKLLSIEYLILPATTLTDSCYNQMFYGCTSLTTAPKLSATILANSCYSQMFYGCTSLTTVPELPATTLAVSCYANMFYNCTSLTTAPELPATTLTQYCYNSMFSGCTSLTTAPVLSATTLADCCYQAMFNSCTSLTTTPELPVTTLASSCYANMFQSCTSLTTAPELPATTLVSNCYGSMFSGCSSLTIAPKLPATTLARSCYSGMFTSCSSLTTAPELPITTLASDCYRYMFQYCTSLTTAPELPATKLESSCYQGMFSGCTSLTAAPELPATILATYCYNSMFYDCTSLTTAPELPATTLASNCYVQMFYGCSNLNYIKAMFTTTPSTTYTSNWVQGVATSGTFVKNSAATWDVTGSNGIPSGWTVVTVDS